MKRIFPIALSLIVLTFSAQTAWAQMSALWGLPKPAGTGSSGASSPTSAFPLQVPYTGLLVGVAPVSNCSDDKPGVCGIEATQRALNMVQGLIHDLKCRTSLSPNHIPLAVRSYQDGRVALAGTFAFSWECEQDPSQNMEEVPANQNLYEACLSRNCDYVYTDAKGRNFTGNGD